MYRCNYYIYLSFWCLMEMLQQHFVQRLQCLLGTEGHSSNRGFPLQPLNHPERLFVTNSSSFPSAAESGIERHAFQDGVRGVPAEFTSYSHHPDCAHHSRHAGTVGHHYHEHAQRRAHPEAVLGQIQRPHLFRYKRGSAGSALLPCAAPVVSGCDDNRTTALI